MSDRLREATRSLHRSVERSVFMSRLLRGDLALRDYAALLANLLPIYAALERGLGRESNRAFLAALPLAGLARTAAIERDLDELRRAEPIAEPGPASLEYAHRIDALGGAEPARLVAHAYVRYLGDLAGGQILSRIVAARIGAPVGFYDFGPPKTLRTLADAFRGGLDRLVLDRAEADAVEAEALWGFEQHARLFDELAPPVR